MNQHLKGYTVSVGHAHLNPLNFSLTLQQLVIRQQANPEPPVADVPRLKLSVEWTRLLTFHLVADAVFKWVPSPRRQLKVQAEYLRRRGQMNLACTHCHETLTHREELR